VPILRLALMVAALACLYVGWSSWSAGYYPEIALLRGLLAFIAVSFVGYLAELVVATTPSAEDAAAGEDGVDDEDEIDEDEIDGASEAPVSALTDEPAAGAAQAEPSNVVSLGAAREAREDARLERGQAA
jgi:hypothetical protein